MLRFFGPHKTTPKQPNSPDMDFLKLFICRFLYHVTTDIMLSSDVAGVLQEAGDAYSRART